MAAIAAGISVAAAAAYGGRLLLKAITAPRMRRFYEGGFEQVMSRREAARILGVRQSAEQEKIKQAYKRVMMANHPDAGGSAFIARKINEAKEMLLVSKSTGSASVF